MVDNKLHRNYTVAIGALRFEWDQKKNSSNVSKHNVSFEDALSVFWDPFGTAILDPDHSDDEERYIFIGISSTMKLLIVCHCYTEQGEAIRIISARRATKIEEKDYGRRTNARRI
ncbi:MAG: BrnT family toxin [Clostridiales Family XIII bacterium]|jgi:uncharacterized DUF497 family protein|nr:BrnT family toxin [Clostridiales Family XIII bacterium]